MNNKQIIDKYTQIEKLRNEINQLNEVYNNWTYYDVESLLYTIREKQVTLRNLEANTRINNLEEY
ncbi:MAG: hypothetical protein GX895_03895 [Clostridiales bacterium]|uniref:hypothetical protein n=1 Tax=Clostridium sp. N3C TaxID=1776758 RepID=UPI00092DF1D3|nr:hypothetical protein [Clostridium sp. N3C]NLZ47922.1 hypothetical protein [Clostridiales bacterium]SCN26397.1 hypothetical protein N3C_2813 [Clostridium sp. N3C]